MEQPKGFVLKELEHKVYKVHKALYGLKQALRAWYEKLDAYLAKIDFQKSAWEPTLYVKSHKNDFPVICVYVDDLIYTGNSFEMMKAFKESMMQNLR